MRYAWLGIGVLFIITLVALLMGGCQTVPAHQTPAVVIPPSTTPTQVIIRQAMDLPWIVSASTFCMTAGVLGLLFAPPGLKTLCLMVVIGSAVFLGLSLLVAVYAKWFALGALGLAVGLVIYALVNRSWLQQEIRDHLFKGGQKPV